MDRLEAVEAFLARQHWQGWLILSVLFAGLTLLIVGTSPGAILTPSEPTSTASGPTTTEADQKTIEGTTTEGREPPTRGGENPTNGGFLPPAVRDVLVVITSTATVLSTLTGFAALWIQYRTADL